MKSQVVSDGQYVRDSVSRMDREGADIAPKTRAAFGGGHIQFRRTEADRRPGTPVPFGEPSPERAARAPDPEREEAELSIAEIRARAHMINRRRGQPIG